MQTYQVTEIKSFSAEVYGNNKQHRTVFKVAGNGNWLSAFVANPLTPGQSISGDIVPKEVDGKTYYNFNFPRPGAVSGPTVTAQNPDKFAVSNQEIKNLIGFKVMSKLDRIERLLERSLGLDPEAMDNAINASVSNEDSVNPF